MRELGQESNALLEAARGGDEPTEADRERVRMALAARLAGGAAAGIGASAAGKSLAAAAVRAGWATKVLVAATLACAVGAGAWRMTRPTLGTKAVTTSEAPKGSESTAVAVEAVEPPLVAVGLSPPPSASPEPQKPSARPSVRAVAVGAVGTPAASSPTHTERSTGGVAAEVRLLSEAQANMRNGDASHALLLLEEHARRFPKGALGEERDAATVAALCALGRSAEARDLAERFLRATPRSPLAGPVRASCGGSSGIPAPPF
jgi:hypothetical protein